jgi:hypothetical protein
MIQVGIVSFLLLSLALLGRLTSRFSNARTSSGPVTASVAVQCLGEATNFLVEPGRTWKLFSVSNGTSKTLFYQTSGVDYRPVAGWVSRLWTATSVTMSGSSPFVVAPSNSATFYASIPTPNIPWRLRVICYEHGWSDPLWRSFYKFKNKLEGLPPSNTTKWSGQRHEVTSGQITP